jgi:hypothetical protein
MTTEEHQLMIFMFERLHEAVGTISEALIQRGLWSREEQATLSQMVHDDDGKVAEYLDRARSDYLRAAAGLGVETGIKTEPPN